jgi:heme exporter protein B
MTIMFSLILTQTLTHAFRKGGGAFGTLAFYIIIITIFTFGLSPEALHSHAGAVMCVAMLLASITALPLMYERDYEDGTLEQYLLQPMLLEWLVLAKILGQWLSITLPIVAISPLIAIFANLSPNEMLRCLLLLLMASPGMVAIGSIAAALTLGAKRGGLLQALITLPLYIPILIFAASGTGQGALLFLAGMTCASLPLACFICAALIRVSQE